MSGFDFAEKVLVEGGGIAGAVVPAHIGAVPSLSHEMPRRSRLLVGRLVRPAPLQIYRKKSHQLIA